ncbi:hypothetical protein GP486_002618 [Trichoglossum hirsutum]|uniref:Xylanolytic transcriptional activator regulatory domain-containing protein n=1 Tax=Trichoglossum hirsutum TaxID=265104 RepID=A0A9P8RRJ6_9PEZI|nr:hypothetical protein GP486_002618 [Trichoglossum hirsutum]
MTQRTEKKHPQDPQEVNKMENEVGKFVHQSFSNPATAPMMNELRAYHERFTKRYRKVVSTSPICDMSQILDLLPPRLVCDRLVREYLSIFEKTMRILHAPSFLEEFNRFWEPREVRYTGFDAFIPQLSVVLIIASGLRDQDSSRRDTMERHLREEIICRYIETWLDSLQGRARLTLSTLQTQALLTLAQQVRSAQADRVWNATGKLVRSSMTAGLHRDPSEFPDVSLFEGELRRRLWMTVVEMDLQASLLCGMPIMVHGGDFTCASPVNVDDLDLFDGMREPPTPKPLDQLTDSVFQVALAGSLLQRLRAVSAAAAGSDNILTYVTELTRYLQFLPSILRLNSTPAGDFGHLFGIVMLNIYVRRVLSYLYRSSSLSSPDGDAIPEAQTAGIQSSLTILSYQNFFDPGAVDSNLGDSIKHWDLFHIFCRGDIMQAALDACLYAQLSSLVPWTKTGVVLAIDSTLNCLMRRLSRNGSDVKDALRLSVVSQFIKSDSIQGNAETLMTEGAYNVLMACRQRLPPDHVFTSPRNDQVAESTYPAPPPTLQLVSENGGVSADLPEGSSGGWYAPFDLPPHVDIDDVVSDSPFLVGLGIDDIYSNL